MLTGKLVQLRPVELTDLDRYFHWINDPEVAQFLDARSLYSIAQEEEFVRRATLQTRPPEVTLAIETLADSRHIGSVSLHAIHSEDRRGRLGIMIGDKTCWDRGFGTDAILTMLRYGFEELNLNRIDLTVRRAQRRAASPATASAASSKRDGCGNTGSRRGATGTRWSWRCSRTTSSPRSGRAARHERTPTTSTHAWPAAYDAEHDGREITTDDVAFLRRPRKGGRGCRTERARAGLRHRPRRPCQWRLPALRVTGLDSSPAMLGVARGKSTGRQPALGRGRHDVPFGWRSASGW